MSLERVKCTCPQCGEVFYDMQYTDDDWYRVGTNRLLCPECSKAAIIKILEAAKCEYIPGRTCSDERFRY